MPRRLEVGAGEGDSRSSYGNRNFRDYLPFDVRQPARLMHPNEDMPFEHILDQSDTDSPVAFPP